MTDETTERNERGQFTEGNTAGIGAACGAEGALKRISDGAPLVGLAHDAEQAVIVELEAAGRAAIVTRNARRLQAACDLFWNAVTKAAQDGDLEKLDKYVARFGWLSSASLRAWAQVGQEQKDTERGVSAGYVLDAIRGGDNGNVK